MATRGWKNKFHRDKNIIIGNVVYIDKLEVYVLFAGDNHNLTAPYTVILLPICPASLVHKNPQRHKIIHGICLAGGKEWLIGLKIFW